MFKNYDVRILGIVSGVSLVVGFTTGYFTRRYLSYTDSNHNQVDTEKNNDIYVQP